jgi:hypothetical protein
MPVERGETGGGERLVTLAIGWYTIVIWYSFCRNTYDLFLLNSSGVVRGHKTDPTNYNTTLLVEIRFTKYGSYLSTHNWKLLSPIADCSFYGVSTDWAIH